MVTTTTTELVETGEKRDALGRRRTPLARRAELLAEFRQSGLTQSAFARREGIRYSTFCTWAELKGPWFGVWAELSKRPTGVPLGADDWAR